MLVLEKMLLGTLVFGTKHAMGVPKSIEFLHESIIFFFFLLKPSKKFLMGGRKPGRFFHFKSKSIVKSLNLF